MKIAIYSRVSQDDVHSIENQICRCKAYLEAQGYEVAAVFTDIVNDSSRTLPVGV